MGDEGATLTVSLQPSHRRCEPLDGICKGEVPSDVGDALGDLSERACLDPVELLRLDVMEVHGQVAMFVLRRAEFGDGPVVLALVLLTSATCSVWGLIGTPHAAILGCVSTICNAYRERVWGSGAGR